MLPASIDRFLDEMRADPAFKQSADAVEDAFEAVNTEANENVHALGCVDAMCAVLSERLSIREKFVELARMLSITVPGEF